MGGCNVIVPWTVFARVFGKDSNATFHRGPMAHVITKSSETVRQRHFIVQSRKDTDDVTVGDVATMLTRHYQTSSPTSQPERCYHKYGITYVVVYAT